MSTAPSDPRIDRLYKLLPAIYRMRDAEQGYPLKALLRVIAEQVNVVEDDIAQLYENWFIETADDWAVPYIAELIGYRPVLAAGSPASARDGRGLALDRALIPRREVANTIRYRRRKGTLYLLELLANNVAGWPARAVEYFKLLGWNQNINHLWLERARTVDLRRVEDLDLIAGPFDPFAHTVEERRSSSHRRTGRYNIPSVGVFVWRLYPYSVTYAPAYCAEEADPHCMTFNVLGQDAPLFIKPEPEAEATDIAGELNVPARIRRLAFDKHKELFYGAGKSLAIWAEGWAGFDPDQPIPAAAIIPADLSGWQYEPMLGQIAVDPVLGRFAFPPSQLPKKGVRVSYHYGFSANIGGGEYARPIFNPSPREVEVADPDDASVKVKEKVEPAFYRVGRKEPFQRIGQALEQWSSDNPRDAVIEVQGSGVYVEPIAISLAEDQTLQLRAANRSRPVIHLLNWHMDMPDALTVTMGRGSSIVFDGFLITGRPVYITGPEQEEGAARAAPCGSEVVIRHCTLVPGWAIDCDCEPKRPAEPSLELFNIRASVRIEHSIIGAIQVHENEVKDDPLPLSISDSLLDATGPAKEAIGAPGYDVAHAVLTFQRCTVFGIVSVHTVALAEDSIFNDCVNVARRQLGCMRFCYVPPGCLTPRRYRCQPDEVQRAVEQRIQDPPSRAAEIVCEQLRVRPQFTSRRYGLPGYGQLARTCAEEIKRGAEDESEMGVFHDLFQPQREANLLARLEEYTPAGMEVGIIYET